MRLDSVIPAECLFGRRLGFYYEMLATCLLPLISFLLILLVAFVVYAIEHKSSKKEYAEAKAKHHRFVQLNLHLFAGTSEKPPAEPKPPISMKEKLNRPQVWTLNIWAWMVLFPVVTRKMVKMMPAVQTMMGPALEEAGFTGEDLMNVSMQIQEFGASDASIAADISKVMKAMQGDLSALLA